VLGNSLGYKECEAIAETITLPSQGHESIFENPVPIVAKTREFFSSPQNTVETPTKV
jgi:hypothetical protein